MGFISLTPLEEVFNAKSLISLFKFARLPDASCQKMGGEFDAYGSNDSNVAVLEALGTLIDYVGNEISVNDLFERLLWSQRYYNNPSAQVIWKMAFLLPMEGPLHKTALRTLDTLYEKGLFKGNRRGHMFGTAFFGDTGRSYRVRDEKITSSEDHVRNGMWIRAIDEMSDLLKDPVFARPRHEDAVPLTRIIRQQISLLSEGLNLTSAQDKIKDRTVKFEIITNGNEFQIIEGEEVLVVQFFRHYGHPIRSRGREILQMTIVTAFDLLFFVDLLCFLLWMPTGMQIVWLSYQLYTTLALQIYHFADGHHWATTEEKICRAFRVAEAKHEDAQIILGTDFKTAVHATLIRIAHDSFVDGRAHVERLLSESVYEKQDSGISSSALSRESSDFVSLSKGLLTQGSQGDVATKSALFGVHRA